MPYVRAAQQEGSSQGQGGAQSAGGDTKQTEKIYSARETAIFSRGILAAVLSPEQTFAFSLLEGNVYAGTFTVDAKTYVFLKNEGSVDVKSEEIPSISLTASCKVQLSGEGETASPEKLAKGELSAEEETRLSEILTGHLTELWEACARTDCDLLFFRRSLRRASLSQYAAWKDIPLSQIPFTAVIRAESLH